MGTTNLNTQNGIVRVLKEEHENAKIARFYFVKYVLITGTLNAILASLIYLLLGAYIRSGIHFFAIILTFYLVIRDSIKKINLKQIGEIVFDNYAFTNHANSEAVYQSTRDVCKIIGLINGKKSIVNLIHFLTVINVLTEVIEFIVNQFTAYA